MNAASILRSKVIAVASAGVIGAGLLGGIAFAATPNTGDAVSMTAPVTGASVTNADREKAGAKLKAALDALVAKNVITQAQEDAILAALAGDHKDHPRVKEFIGDAVKESVDYLGLPADQVKAQLKAGKSLGEIANATPGKSRDGLLGALDDAAAARIKAAVDAGKITQSQAEALRTKVDEAIVRVVDHSHQPKPATGTTKPTPKPTN